MQTIVGQTTGKNAVETRLLLRLGQWWYRWGNQRQVASACDLVPRILAAIPPQPGFPRPTSWRIQQAKMVQTRMNIVVALGSLPGPPVAMLKLTRNPKALADLQRQEAALAKFHADPRLGAWRTLLPRQLASGEMAGHYYAVVNYLPGTDARAIIRDPASRLRFQNAAAAAIGQLHRITAVPVTLDEAALARWIDQPLRQIHAWNETLPRFFRHDTAIKRLKTELYAALAGRVLPASWIHSDLHPGNLLVTPDGSRITGILDWDRAVPGELPLLDMVHLLLSVRRLAQRRELGEMVVAYLHGERWTTQECDILSAPDLPLAGDAAWDRAVVLLTWLQHVATNLESKTVNYYRKWWWLEKNVMNVLRWANTIHK